MRKRYLLLVMTVLFGIALLAVDNYTQEGRAPLSQRQAAEPDYYGKDLYNRRYNEQGKLQQSFAAASSAHYPLSNNTVFQQPVVHNRDEDGHYWQVSAAEGSMLDKEDKLLLRRQVEIRPLDNHIPNAVIIQTESLDYFTQRQLAQTAQAVTITRPDTRITATGMQMDIKKQRMELHSEVNTHYVPQ